MVGVGSLLTAIHSELPTSSLFSILFVLSATFFLLGGISLLALCCIPVPHNETLVSPSNRNLEKDTNLGDSLEMGHVSSQGSPMQSTNSSSLDRASVFQLVDDTHPVLESLVGPSKSKTRIDFHFHKLGLQLNSTGQQVLQGVTGHCVSGTVTAVMGPSGAGKTTFLNTLAGKATYGQTTGTVLINGVMQNTSRFSNIIGFVPQEDIMHRELTVKEILTTYAWLRQPAGATQRQIESVVRDVIHVLDLRRVRHSVVGDEAKRGISGGQRKRVNVGMEMVADPSVLFLDEPTSGLDSTTSFDLVSALSELANRGTNVITVLHTCLHDYPCRACIVSQSLRSHSAEP